MDAHVGTYVTKHILEETPSKEEIKAIFDVSGLPLKKFFNSSGKKYRELGLKDKLPEMTEEEAFALLASDGMLLKRPLVTDGSTVTVGFKEDTFEKAWL